MTVKQEFTGESSNLRAEYQKIQRENAKLLEQNQRLAREAANAHNAAKGGADAASGSISGMNQLVSQGAMRLVSMAASWASITTAIQLANAALEEQKRLQQGVSQTQTTLANSQAEVIKNIGPASPAETKKFLAQVDVIRKQTGFPSANPLFEAAAEGLSASAGDQAATLAALRQSARIAANKPDQLHTFVGGALDVGKASGIADARKNLGFLLSAGAEARTVDPQKSAENIAPAVFSAVSTVPKQDRVQASLDAGALFSAFSNAADDVEGRRTSHEVQHFSVQLRDFFEKGTKMKVGRHMRTVKPGSDPGGLMARWEALQNDPKLGEAFLAQYSGEQKFRIPVEQLIRGGQTAEFARSSRGKINFDEKLFESKAAQLRGLTPNLANAAVERQSLGASEAFQAGDLKRGVAGKSRDIAFKAMDDTSDLLSYPRRIMQRTAFDVATGVGVDPQFAADKLLAEREKDVRRGSLKSWLRNPAQALTRAIPGSSGVVNTLFAESSDGWLSDDQRKQIGRLREARAEIQSVQSDSSAGLLGQILSVLYTIAVSSERSAKQSGASVQAEPGRHSEN